MNKLLLILASATLASLSPQTLEAKDPPPDPEAVLRAVREGAAQNEELTLDGRLRVRTTGKKHPFRMTIRKQQIAFLFENDPQHTIVLDLGQNSFLLRERHGKQGDWDKVPAAKHGQLLRGTGVNYLDISLAYLYWPNPVFLEEDVVAERVTWKLRVTNPDKAGPYSRLDLWVDQQTVGLMRMQAYDHQGRLVKKMEVKEVQRVKDRGKKVWTLEKMSVLVFDPKTRRVVSHTYMEL